ncbi:TetR/AcrR family transcriptional regulator [Kribbella sancticallisti]|uniref:TetR/AcrR family transcriptional regulator n=1 Tax=Kribbella sancticallisti TaxID=460087 RepID=A0ABN2DKM8_9ACTN
MQLRADAQRNRDLILAAADAVFLELGPGAPLDQIAERAGVGNATLYRRFPTREDLLKQVAMDNMRQVDEEARAALAEEPDAWSALVRFCHAVVERRIVALLPIIGSHVPIDKEFKRVRRQVVDGLGELLAAGRREGVLRADVEVGDLVLVLATVARPLPAVPEEVAAAVRPRHLGLVLDGLRADSATQLAGEPIGAEEVAGRFRR